jgi:predicted nucleotidyltransferase
MLADVVVLRAEARLSLSEIAEIARPWLDAVGAERAVAFGSFARGEADGYSDLDLAVVMETDAPRTDRWRALRPLLDTGHANVIE